MATAPLECEELRQQHHVRPCVISMACWWREIRELEKAMEYNRSSVAARDAWDELLASEILLPHEALYVELRGCVQAWRRITRHNPLLYPSLVDQLVQVSIFEQLDLTRYGILAAFRLRQRIRRLTAVNAFSECQPARQEKDVVYKPDTQRPCMESTTSGL
jgi:hypothetical protein